MPTDTPNKPKGLAVITHGTKEGVKAALDLIRGAGFMQHQNPEVMASMAKGEVIYVHGSTGEYSGGWSPGSNTSQYAYGLPVVDIRSAFPKPAPVVFEMILTAKPRREPQFGTYERSEKYRVVINKGETQVGCQTFYNEDILRVADQIRKVQAS